MTSPTDLARKLTPMEKTTLLGHEKIPVPPTLYQLCTYGLAHYSLDKNLDMTEMRPTELGKRVIEILENE